MGSELTLALISRPCSPSREKMTKSLSRKKHLMPPLDILELCFRECLKALAFVKSLSWRSVGPPDLRGCSQPTLCPDSGVFADRSPRSCSCFSPSSLPVRGSVHTASFTQPSPAEHSSMLLTLPAVRWVTPLERALWLYTGISPPMSLSCWLGGFYPRERVSVSGRTLVGFQESWNNRACLGRVSSNPCPSKDTE